MVGVTYTETIVLEDTEENSLLRTLATESLSLSDGDTALLNKLLSDTTTLTDTYDRVWEATPVITETTNLTDNYSYNWTLARTYSETTTLSETEVNSISRLLSEVLSLLDGDDTKVKLVSPEGGYIAIYSEETTLSAALNELIELMEKEGCPTTQTKIALTHDGTNYAAVAIVKRH